jgi:hypothetical protein
LVKILAAVRAMSLAAIGANRLSAAGGDFHEGWTFVVLQHTDCGILRMQDERARLAGFFGVDDGALDARSVADPHAAVGVDVEAILGADGLPNGMLCVGMVFDVDTGLVELTWARNDCLNVPTSSAAGWALGSINTNTRGVAGDWFAVGRSVHPGSRHLRCVPPRVLPMIRQLSWLDPLRAHQDPSRQRAPEWVR